RAQNAALPDASPSVPQEQIMGSRPVSTTSLAPARDLSPGAAAPLELDRQAAGEGPASATVHVIGYKPIPFGHSVAATADDNHEETWQRFLQHAPGRSRERTPIISSPSRSGQPSPGVTGEDSGLVMWEISPPAEVIRPSSEVIFRAQKP